MREGSGGISKVTNECSDSMRPRPEITQLPETDLILAGITPRQLLRIAGSQLPSHYRKRLERFRYGAGAFKIDYALGWRRWLRWNVQAGPMHFLTRGA